MRSTYRFLAYLIAVLVVVQAGAIAWAFFGMTDWIDNDNGVVDKALLECTDCDQNFTAEWGFAIHMFFNGAHPDPAHLAGPADRLVLREGAPRRGDGRRSSSVLVILQVIVLPMLSREVDSGFGALHGINALVLFGVAVDGRQPRVAAGRSGRARGTRHRLRVACSRPVAALGAAWAPRRPRLLAAARLVLAAEPAARHLRHGRDGRTSTGAAGRSTSTPGWPG